MNPYAAPTTESLDAIERKRRIVKAMTYPGVALFLLALIGGRTGLLASFAGQSAEVVFWGLLVVAAALMFGTRLIWKCPQCGAWPGNVQAEHCRACGQPLQQGLERRMPDGSFVEASHAPPPPEHDPAGLERFQTVVRRVMWLNRASGLRLIPVALGLGALAGVIAYFVSPKPEIEVSLLITMAVGIGSWAILFRVLRTIRDFVVMGLKCPGCDKRLTNTGINLPFGSALKLAPFCTNCGAQVPAISAAS